MQFFVGTSGYSYKEWKGNFYPEKLPAKEMLGYYAQQFSTVEMNNTFYRMPSAAAVASWAEQTPASFRFVLKAPQTITHRKRLKNVEEDVDFFLIAAAALGERRGPLLFQLPPNMKRDLPRLEAFLGLLEGRAKVAFEFRHESWLEADTIDLLRAHQGVLCVADADELPGADLLHTADWGYVRLRREGYTDEALLAWIKSIRSQEWKEAYVFFRHEDTAAGVKLATRFLELSGN